MIGLLCCKGAVKMNDEMHFDQLIICSVDVMKYRKSATHCRMNSYWLSNVGMCVR